MKASVFALLVTTLLMAGCNRAPQTKEAVQSAVIEHLGSASGLNISGMDIEVTSVSFSGKQALATVLFRPKSSPEQGMQWNYTLEERAKKWVVTKTASGGASNPHSTLPPPPASDLPPGHPSASGPAGKPETEK